jgi:hypothetical protein
VQGPTITRLNLQKTIQNKPTTTLPNEMKVVLQKGEQEEEGAKILAKMNNNKDKDQIMPKTD